MIIDTITEVQLDTFNNRYNYFLKNINIQLHVIKKHILLI